MEEFEKEDTVTTFLIPDELCSGAGLAASWVTGTELAVFPSKRFSKGKESNPSEFAPCDPKIFMLRREVTLFHPIVRKLVNESNGTFLSLRKLGERFSYGDSRPELLKISRQYRAIVRACLESLHEAVERETDDERIRTLDSLVNVFHCVECVWHICEILYIDDIPGDVVMPQLLEWVRIHFPNHEQAASRILDKCETGAQNDPDYWNTLTGMIMQGRTDIARALLRLHSESDGNQFLMADDLLRSVPVYDAYSTLSVNEFKISRKHWQLACESKINAKTFQTEPHLEHIMRLITGQRSAMEAARLNYTSWWESLGAWMLYVSPGARRGDLGRIARDCASVRPIGAPVPEPTRLDNILLALMEDDLHRVLHDIQQLSDDGWLATHLTDLLVHCGKLKILDENMIDITDQLRDSLVLDYGSLLAGHRSLWPVGFSYLSLTSRDGSDVERTGEGHHRTASSLSALPLGSERRTLKMLHEARKYNLHDIAEAVCRRRAAVSARRGREGAALSWALRASAAPSAARFADAALRRYVETGRLDGLDLVGALGTDMMISDRLIFLAKYSDFHRLYKNGEFAEAGKLIVSLLSSKITPSYFWTTLLTDTLPMLERDEIVFGADDTYEIMHCVEERTSEAGADEGTELLRLACARNLARTLLVDDADGTR